MKETTRLNQSILEYLKNLGIICGINMDVVSINRTSMCNYSLCHGLDEGNCYKMVLELIKENYSDPIYWITYSGKTDDDYFLSVFVKSN